MNSGDIWFDVGYQFGFLFYVLVDNCVVDVGDMVFQCLLIVIENNLCWIVDVNVVQFGFFEVVQYVK